MVLLPMRNDIKKIREVQQQQALKHVSHEEQLKTIYNNFDKHVETHSNGQQ